MHPSSSVRDDLFLLGLCWNALMHVQTITEALLTASLKQLSKPRSLVTAPGEGCLQRLALATLYTSPPSTSSLSLSVGSGWPSSAPSLTNCHLWVIASFCSWASVSLSLSPGFPELPLRAYVLPLSILSLQRPPQAEKQTEDMQNPVEVGSRQGSLLGQTLGRPAGSNLLTWLSNRIHCCWHPCLPVIFKPW